MQGKDCIRVESVIKVHNHWLYIRIASVDPKTIKGLSIVMLSVTKSQSYNYSAEDTEWHVIGNLIKNLLNVFSMAQDYKWVCELMSQLWSSTKRVVILIVLRRRSANLLLVWMNNLLVEQVDKKINLRAYIEIKKKLEKKKSLTQSRYSYSYMVGSE